MSFGRHRERDLRLIKCGRPNCTNSETWYIYFTASPKPHSEGEEEHRIFVLKSQTKDPLGDYDLYGPLETGNGPDGTSPNVWAIDLTITFTTRETLCGLVWLGCSYDTTILVYCGNGFSHQDYWASSATVSQ